PLPAWPEAHYDDYPPTRPGQTSAPAPAGYRPAALWLVPPRRPPAAHPLATDEFAKPPAGPTASRENRPWTRCGPAECFPASCRLAAGASQPDTHPTHAHNPADTDDAAPGLPHDAPPRTVRLPYPAPESSGHPRASAATRCRCVAQPRSSNPRRCIDRLPLRLAVYRFHA